VVTGWNASSGVIRHEGPKAPTAALGDGSDKLGTTLASGVAELLSGPLALGIAVSPVPNPPWLTTCRPIPTTATAAAAVAMLAMSEELNHLRRRFGMPTTSLMTSSTK
jgi:hypothetical protein